MQPIMKSRRKALVVEERAADRDLGVAILSQLSYEAEAAASAGDALARLGQERFALVLLSSTLPDLAAPELAELRRLAEPISLPIVVVHAPDRAPERGNVELGAIGHLSRPLTSAAIKRLVEAAGSAAPREAPGEPIVDMDHLLSFTDGDLELESELSVLFLSSAEAYFDRMSRSLQAGTPWTSSVHALKGASANLGARRLAALARTAEHQPPAAADLAVIRRAIDEVRAFFAERHRVGGKERRQLP
jgi:CheY-like chemotaxis protein/HPt (histidine-containing phosphotransfer) domain-containing protein